MQYAESAIFIIVIDVTPFSASKYRYERTLFDGHRTALCSTRMCWSNFTVSLHITHYACLVYFVFHWMFNTERFVGWFFFILFLFDMLSAIWFCPVWSYGTHNYIFLCRRRSYLFNYIHTEFPSIFESEKNGSSLHFLFIFQMKRWNIAYVLHPHICSGMLTCFVLFSMAEISCAF